MAKKGDKYIIEIGDTVVTVDGRFYLVKGIPSLLLKDNVLSSLEKYNENPDEFPQKSISIGDEVEGKFGQRFYVTYVSLSGKVKGIDETGCYYECDKEEVVPTGEISHQLRNFLAPW